MQTRMDAEIVVLFEAESEVSGDQKYEVQNITSGKRVVK